MQLRSHYSPSKAQALITSSYLSSLYFFPNKMLLFTVPGNTQGCWETYAILPCMLTCPWLGGSSPSRAFSSDDWNRWQHTHVNRVHSGWNTPHSTADPPWHLICDRTLSFNRIKYSPHRWDQNKQTKKKVKITLMVNENNW